MIQHSQNMKTKSFPDFFYQVIEASLMNEGCIVNLSKTGMHRGKEWMFFTSIECKITHMTIMKNNWPVPIKLMHYALNFIYLGTIKYLTLQHHLKIIRICGRKHEFEWS